MTVMTNTTVSNVIVTQRQNVLMQHVLPLMPWCHCVIHSKSRKQQYSISNMRVYQGLDLKRFKPFLLFCSGNSAGLECHPYKMEVVGSNPTRSTIQIRQLKVWMDQTEADRVKILV